MIKIGTHQLNNRVLLAPMAGVTDRPFRELCRYFGVGLAVSEMLTSNTKLWNSKKSQQRLSYQHEVSPRSVQIAGNDPSMMASAAQQCVKYGAQIIDINMGCPAKKVCNKAAGSALLRDEFLVNSILTAVTNSVNVPVTLKIRTGWNSQQKNGVSIARIAEDCNIKLLAVHGRTRACGFKGEAEYDTIAKIKQSVAIPVIANGDINSPQKAKQVLDYTGADGVMIGRAAQGKPWIVRDIDTYLTSGHICKPPTQTEVGEILLTHLQKLHSFYGEFLGIRIARKHVGWYLQTIANAQLRKQFNHLETIEAQRNWIHQVFQ